MSADPRTRAGEHAHTGRVVGEAAASALARHWDDRYASTADREASWFQARPTASLELLAVAGAGPLSALVDVGGGDSRLVDHLLAGGWRDLTVLDVSAAALTRAQSRVGATAAVSWVTADVRAWEPARTYDVWHDRAVFHFLVEAADRRAYVEKMRSALAPGGLVVVGTFAADGPTECSGLPVVRYDADSLVAALGDAYDEVARRRDEHRTPLGAVQPFTWVAVRARGAEPSP